MQLLNLPVHSSEIKIFLDILNQRAPAAGDGMDCDKIISLAKSHDLCAFFFYRLQGADPKLLQQIAPKLRPYYMTNIHRNLCLWNEFLRVNTAFREKGIAMLPIKGVDILARFYPAFDLRSMCDMDILIKESQLAEAERALSVLGYRKELFGLKEEYWRKRQCTITFRKDRIAMDVHWGLDFKRGRRDMLPGIWDRARQVEPGDHKIKIFSPEDAVFAFALHLRRYGSILALKQVLDTARIIGQTVDFDWSYVLEESQRGQMQATLYFLLTQVALFTDTPIPEDVLARLQVPFWQKKRIETFLRRHTFLSGSSLKTNYLKAHLLLYDSVWEAVLYLIDIPHEQFCKYYGFKPYSARSVLLYNVRLLYMPFRHVLGRPVGSVQ